MSDPTSPPTIGDVYSGIIPPISGSQGPTVTKTLFVDPANTTLVTQYNLPVAQPAAVPSDILAGDNPNSTNPPLAGTDPANMMEMPPIRRDDILDRLPTVAPNQGDNLVERFQPNEDTPPEGGKYGDSTP